MKKSRFSEAKILEILKQAEGGVPNPAHFQGTPTEIEAEFNRVFSMLERSVKAFLRLPLEQMEKMNSSKT